MLKKNTYPVTKKMLFDEVLMNQPARFLQLALCVLSDTWDMLWQLHPSTWRPWLWTTIHGCPCRHRPRRRR